MFHFLLRIRNRIKETFSIGQTKINLTLDFTHYPKNIFEFDMLLVRLINSKEWKKRQVSPELLAKARLVQRNEILFHKEIYKQVSKNFTPNSNYDNFKKTIVNMLAQHLKHILEESMKDLVSEKKEISVFFKLINTYEEDYLAQYCAEKSSSNAIYFEMSGSLLAGRVYSPWVYAKHIDAAFLEKILSHELQHHLDRRLVKIQAMFENELKKAAQKKSHEFNANAMITYSVLSRLYTEGIASFVEQKRSSKITFEQSKVRMLKKLLRKLAKLKDEQKVRALYEEKFCPTSHTGEYYLGSLMCYFIGLSLQKQEGQKTIEILSPEKKKIPFEKLGKYLSNHKIVQLPGLEQETHDIVYAKIAQAAKSDVFFELYINSCKNLEIPDSLIFLDDQTLVFLRQLTKELTQKYGNPVNN